MGLGVRGGHRPRRAPRGAELGVDVRHVALDRAHREVQLGGDLLVGTAPPDQPEDVELAERERCAGPRPHGGAEVGLEAAGPRTLVVLTAVDEPGWQEWVTELGPDFAPALQIDGKGARNAEQLARTARMLDKQKWAFATVAPRGIGPTRSRR